MPDGAMEELRAPASWDDAEERAEEDASPNAEGVSCMHFAAWTRSRSHSMVRRFVLCSRHS